VLARALFFHVHKAMTKVGLPPEKTIRGVAERGIDDHRLGICQVVPSPVRTVTSPLEEPSAVARHRPSQ